MTQPAEVVLAYRSTPDAAFDRRVERLARAIRWLAIVALLVGVLASIMALTPLRMLDWWMIAIDVLTGVLLWRLGAGVRRGRRGAALVAGTMLLLLSLGTVALLATGLISLRDDMDFHVGLVAVSVIFLPIAIGLGALGGSLLHLASRLAPRSRTPA